MIKSPLRYPGGKSRAVELIDSLLPEFDEFREPFLGGGSVFVYAKQKYPAKKFWGNDLYLELYKFWEYAQKDINALLNKRSSASESRPAKYPKVAIRWAEFTYTWSPTI